MAIRETCRDLSDSKQIEIGLSGAHASALVYQIQCDKLPEKPEGLQDFKVSQKSSYRWNEARWISHRHESKALVQHLPLTFVQSFLHSAGCIWSESKAYKSAQPIETPCLILLDLAQISLALWAASLCCCILILSLLWPSTCSNVQIRCEPYGHHSRCVTDTCVLHTGHNSLQHQATSTCGAWTACRGCLVLWPETNADRTRTHVTVD